MFLPFFPMTPQFCLFMVFMVDLVWKFPSPLPDDVDLCSGSLLGIFEGSWAEDGFLPLLQGQKVFASTLPPEAIDFCLEPGSKRICCHSPSHLKLLLRKCSGDADAAGPDTSISDHLLQASVTEESSFQSPAFPSIFRVNTQWRFVEVSVRFVYVCGP